MANTYTQIYVRMIFAVEGRCNLCNHKYVFDWIDKGTTCRSWRSLWFGLADLCYRHITPSGVQDIYFYRFSPELMRIDLCSLDSIYSGLQIDLVISK